MKLFLHFSILVIVLMSILATTLFPRVESKPAPAVTPYNDDGFYPGDPIIFTKLSTKKLSTTTTTKPTTTKKIKIINQHFSIEPISILDNQFLLKK